MLIETYQSLSKIREMSIHINNEPLHKFTISKYLGMFIDSNLKWNDHINNMITKFSAKIGILRSLKNIVPNDTLIQIYNAIVQPDWDYGDAVLSSAPYLAWIKNLLDEAYLSAMRGNPRAITCCKVAVCN